MQSHEKPSMEERREAALATRQEAKPARRTRKRSRVELDSTATAKTVTANQSAAPNSMPQGMALSAVDAFKSAAATAYTNEMKAAVPELFDYFEQVNNEVADFMIGEIERAYKVNLGVNEVA